MKRIIGLICLGLFLINASITVQAEGTGDPSNAVACVIPKDATEDSTEVQYFRTLPEALACTASYEKCTLKLLKDISSEAQIGITSGDFIFDLNGKELSSSTETGTCISIQNASVHFKDSSSEKTGTVQGLSSAISMMRDANVIIESGNYEANSWAIITTDTQDTQVILEITGGCFRGSVGVQTSIGPNYEISGGTFYGTQNAVNNNGTMKITGGTFYGEIYNAGGATLNFENGTVTVYEISSHEKSGIQNQGTLNLSGGRISAATDEKEPMNGVGNGNNAILNLYGDVIFQNVETDFLLEKAMNICGTLGNTYRVAMNIPDGAENVVFANAAEGGTLSKENFVSGVTGCVVGMADDGESLYLKKCEHTNITEAYTCGDCGIQMYACIGDKYYLSLAEALEAVKNAESAEKKTVKVLKDILEDGMVNLSILGGTFILDFNGHAIEEPLHVSKGNVTIVGNGGTLNGLTIQENAYVEMSGLTLKGKQPVSNRGTFRMTDGKVDGGQMAIVNMAGTVYLDGGEILAEEIAVMNYGGTVTVGTEDGAGPAIKATVGILNSKYLLQDTEKDADLVIKGGKITAEKDIYNKTGEYPSGSDDSGAGGIPTAAGTVTLKGGTFVNGLRIAADEGVGLDDILAEGYWYYDDNNKKLAVDANALSIDKTVTVRKLAEEASKNQDSDDSTDQETDVEKTVEQDFDENTEQTIYAVAADTGDPMNVGIWIAGLFISGAVLIKKEYISYKETGDFIS